MASLSRHESHGGGVVQRTGKNGKGPSQITNGDSGDLPHIPSIPSSPSPSLSQKGQVEKVDSKLLAAKLDVKFDLPMYNGEVDAEKLDNWIKQIEVYCRVQRIVDEGAKVQLATLRLEGTTLIWWEGKVQKYLRMEGKITSSWHEFTFALNKQFYPLG